MAARNSGKLPRVRKAKSHRDTRSDFHRSLDSMSPAAAREALKVHTQKIMDDLLRDLGMAEPKSPAAVREEQRDQVRAIMEVERAAGTTEWERANHRRAVPEQSVYFIKSEDGPIKIGYTEGHPDFRLETIQTANPYRLIIMGVIPDAGRDIEHRLHCQFDHLAMMGEWFRPGRDLVAYIAAHSEPWPEARVLYDRRAVRSLDFDPEAVEFARHAVAYDPGQ